MYECLLKNTIILSQGKGDMMTYWLVGEDPGKRLARIREEMLGSSLFSSISSDRKQKLRNAKIN